VSELTSTIGTVELPPGLGVSIDFGHLPEILPGNASILEGVNWVDPVVITFTRDGAFLMSFAINRRDIESLDRTVVEFLAMAIAGPESQTPEFPGPRLVS
jgi:hypothetical protein